MLLKFVQGEQTFANLIVAAPLPSRCTNTCVFVQAINADRFATACNISSTFVNICKIHTRDASRLGKKNSEMERIMETTSNLHVCVCVCVCVFNQCSRKRSIHS